MQSLSGVVTAPEAPVRRNMKLYGPTEFIVIEQASTERTYKVIKGRDGKDVCMCGAFIPESYDLDHTLTGYPWICPIRSCRKVFKNMAGLGSHFIVSAKAIFLLSCLDYVWAVLFRGREIVH